MLYGSRASGSSITNCTIQYGAGIQVINVPTFEISGCNFTNNHIPIYVYGSGTSSSPGLIEDNNLTSSSNGHSIQALNSSKLNCIGNDITKTSSGQGQGAGVEYGGGTSGIISDNNISYCDRGISIHWSSSANSYHYPYPAKNNRVRYCDNGIVVYRLSSGEFGTSTAGNQYAWNSIYENTLDAAVGTLYTTYVSTLTAYYNWWGSNPVFSVGPNANFYHDYPLGSDPWYGFAKVNSIASVTDSDINQINTPTEKKGSLWEGIELRLNKKYKEAMDFFISYIKEFPSDQQAYVELYNCRSKETTPELINFFNSLPKEASKDHKLLLSYLYLNEGNIEEAKKVNDLIISEDHNTSLVAKAEINNIYIILYDENKVETAASKFNNLLNLKAAAFETTKEYEDLAYAIESYARVNGKTVPNFSISKNSTAQEIAENEISEEFILLSNYPNPFNPTTKISFNLPQKENMKLTIYDMLGREIIKLADGIYEAGEHKFDFNAANLPSGIYFYNIQTSKGSISKKMILLK